MTKDITPVEMCLDCAHYVDLGEESSDCEQEWSSGPVVDFLDRYHVGEMNEEDIFSKTSCEVCGISAAGWRGSYDTWSK